MTNKQALTELIRAVENDEPLFYLAAKALPAQSLRDGEERLNLIGEAQVGSVDAATRLLEAVLPGWGWMITKNWADVWLSGGDGTTFRGAIKGQPARSLLLATLKALESEQ